MSEKENQTAENAETLKARIAELEAENEKLKATITEATKTLTGYVERERETAIKSILEKTTISKDELEKLDLTQLRLIEKGVDNVKGTVKNVRSAGTAQCEGDSKLTVGCLYHRKERE
jgi:prefoldin subunit 5